jgi:hypothetical protein
MVELTLLLPLFVLLGFATAELGFALTAANRVESAVASAGRVAASSGGQRDADLNVLMNLQAALGDEGLANLDRVVIFRATETDATVPAGCLKPPASTNEQGVPGRCNTYSGATVRSVSATTSGFSADCTGSTGSARDRFWCPTDRRDALSDPPDWIGVYVRTAHRNRTGTHFGDFTLTRQSVYRIQPDFAG